MSSDAQLHVVSIFAKDITQPLIDSAASLFRGLVIGGAALGWVEPPSVAEIEGLLSALSAEATDGDAALVVARRGQTLAALGYWRRYARPTHRPHADIERVAVDPALQGQGVGRAIMSELISSAAATNVEVLTLDLRGDNDSAAALYRSLGFRQYGILERFVAVGDKRYDKLLYALDLRHAGTQD